MKKFFEEPVLECIRIVSEDITSGGIEGDLNNGEQGNISKPTGWE